MTTLERVIAWANQGISMDVTTMILRSENVADSEIASAYNEIAGMENYTTTVERGIGTIRRA